MGGTDRLTQMMFAGPGPHPITHVRFNRHHSGTGFPVVDATRGGPGAHL